MLALLLTIAACQPQLGTPPRLETVEALSSSAVRTTAEPIHLPAPTATNTPPEIQPVDESTVPEIEVWINETSEPHRLAVQSMADDFS